MAAVPQFPPPPTTIKSFMAKVLEVDPNYSRDLNRPVQYIFSNGRKFTRDPNTYTD